MPSALNPNDVVVPGPGKLPAGTVPTSALFVGGSGGGGGALGLIQAHIADSVDAHMAGAIGVEPTYAPTGELILSSVGGTVDGESVLDFIAAVKDILPARPNQLGYSNPSLPISGVPAWDAPSVAGGFTDGGAFVATHHIWDPATLTVKASGTLFPADRGVLAVYSNTDGNYLNPATTTLIGALWLGVNPPPVGVPGAGFVEATRVSTQIDYNATSVGIDTISLDWRLPYLKSYAAYPGAPYPQFSHDFYRYQLAQFDTDSYPVVAGTPGSLLVVHWRETYAITLAAIQPNQLAANLVQTNCYSPAPVAGVFDGGDIENVNRHNFLVDASIPLGIPTFTFANPAGNVISLSGLSCYDGTGFQITGSFQVTGLFSSGYYTGVVNPPDVPTGFGSPRIVQLSFNALGGGAIEYSYYDLEDGGATPFGAANPPLPADTANLSFVNVVLPVPTPFTPDDDGSGFIELFAYPTWDPPLIHSGPFAILFNSYPQTGAGTLSTDTVDPFLDEKYRYVSNYAGAAPSPAIIPVGGDDFDSTAVIVANDGILQVLGHRLRYPRTNYSAYRPVGADYAAVLGGDAPNHIRRYVRIFDTGVARNTGKIRIQGLTLADIQSVGAYTGSEVNDHTGGAIVQLKIPGVTGWMDLGRVKGDPDLTTDDGRGCRTSSTISGADFIFGYDTTSFTVDNGSGEFPIILRISLIKNGIGEGLKVTEVEWQAP